MSLDNNYPWGQNRHFDEIKFEELPLQMLEGGYEVILIAGPNGSGKGSIINGLVALSSDYSLVRRTTTKSIDSSETNYHYEDRDLFIQLVNEGGLLEWSKFGQGYYGTSIKDILLALNSGKNLIIDIDVDGALLLRSIFERIGIKVTDCFVSPVLKHELNEDSGIQRALDILKERLVNRNRGEFSTELEGRIRNARKVLMQANEFRTIIENLEGHLEKAILEIVRKIENPKEP